MHSFGLKVLKTHKVDNISAWNKNIVAKFSNTKYKNREKQAIMKHCQNKDATVSRQACYENV